MQLVHVDQLLKLATCCYIQQLVDGYKSQELTIDYSRNCQLITGKATCCLDTLDLLLRPICMNIH